MNRIILLLCLSLGISYASADNFKVLFVNDASLQYANGKQVKVGDTFSDAKTIKWEKDKQAVKVFNMTTKKQMLLLGKTLMRPDGFDALMRNKHLSTHDAAGLPEDQRNPLDGIFEDEYLLLDPIEIPVDKNIDLEKHHFEASYDYGDTRLTKILKQGEGKVILDKALFEVDGEKLEPRDVTIKIDYVENENFMQAENAADNIQVIFIPDVLE